MSARQGPEKKWNDGRMEGWLNKAAADGNREEGRYTVEEGCNEEERRKRRND